MLRTLTNSPSTNHDWEMLFRIAPSPAVEDGVDREVHGNLGSVTNPAAALFPDLSLCRRLTPPRPLEGIVCLVLKAGVDETGEPDPSLLALPLIPCGGGSRNVVFP